MSSDDDQPALPAPAHRLIGRERELTEVQARLLRRHVRLVTVLGPPGVGKTRLGIGVAEAIAPQFEHGTVFVALTSVTDPALVLNAIARAAGVQDSGSRPLIDNLRAYLRPRQILLCLDNCEHVIAAGPLVADLLAAAPRLKVLAMSRAPLHQYGEYEFPVPPLQLPELTARDRLEELARSPAVALFVERAEAVQPAFALTVGNAGSVAELCMRLDGLPLAIELAAARVKLLTPAAILARLSRRLDLLAGSRHDATGRHRSLRATIDWSYALLSRAESVLLRRLAVFADGWSLEGAEQVCAGEGLDDGEIVPLLANLVDQSLVLTEEWGGEMRYRFLETLHQFAEEKLDASGEREAIARRHRDWYLAMTQEAREGLRGPSQKEWCDRLELEHANLRASLRWTQTQGDGTAGILMGAGLARFWTIRGHVREGRDRLLELLALAGPDERSTSRADVLYEAAHQSSILGEMSLVQRLSQDELAVARELGYGPGVASALGALGIVARLEGDADRGRKLFAEGTAAAREAGDATVLIWNLMMGSYLALADGDLDNARVWLDEALGLADAQGDRWFSGALLTSKAYLAVLTGDFDCARTLLQEGISQSWRLGSQYALAWQLEVLGWILSAEGKMVEAAQFIGAAEAVRDSIGAVLETMQQAGHDQAVTACAHLRPAAYQAAWATGFTRPLAQTISLALMPLSAGAEQPSVSPSAPRMPLSTREREVAVLVAQGNTNRQIATALCISERTAANHVQHILDKLGASSRAQIGTWAALRGLVDSGHGQSASLEQAPGAAIVQIDQQAAVS